MFAPKEPLPGRSQEVFLFGPRSPFACLALSSLLTCLLVLSPSHAKAQPAHFARVVTQVLSYQSQHRVQSSQVRVPGIISMCTGKADCSRLTRGEKLQYRSTTAAIHMHEARGPDCLAELSITFRGTNFRELATPSPHSAPATCVPASQSRHHFRSAGPKEAVHAAHMQSMFWKSSMGFCHSRNWSHLEILSFSEHVMAVYRKNILLSLELA